MKDEVQKFFDEKFKETKDLKEKVEKLEKNNKELTEDLSRANMIIEDQKRAMDVMYELRWSLEIKLTKLEAETWSKDK